MKLRTNLFASLNNGQKESKPFLEVPYSRFSMAFLALLQEEGLISHWQFHPKESRKGGQIPQLRVFFKKKPFLTSCQGGRAFEILRVSTPQRPLYADPKTLWKVNRGLGLYLLSTNRGLLTDRQARQFQIGGEVLCVIR